VFLQKLRIPEILVILEIIFCARKNIFENIFSQKLIIFEKYRARLKP